MAYFTKEEYEAKARYAYRTSSDGISKIAETLAMRQIYHLDENKSTPTQEELDNEDLSDALEDLIYDLEEELEPVQQLSHARHEMHCTDWNDFDCFDKIGHDYSCEETLVDKVNELNKKYNLSDVTLMSAVLPPYFDDGIEYDICCDELGIEYDEDGNNELMYELVAEKWADEKNRINTMIRTFFRTVNERFGTDFPS